MLRCVFGRLGEQAISALCDFTEGWFPKLFWHIVFKKWSNQVNDGPFSSLESCTGCRHIMVRKHGCLI